MAEDRAYRCVEVSVELPRYVAELELHSQAISGWWLCAIESLPDRAVYWLRRDGDLVALREENQRLREALRDVLSLIADEDAGDGLGELVRDTSRDDAPDYLPRMLKLVQTLARAHSLVGQPPATEGSATRETTPEPREGEEVELA